MHRRCPGGEGYVRKTSTRVFLSVLQHLRVTHAVFRNRAAAAVAEREAVVLQSIGGRRMRACSTESCRHTGSSQQRPAGRSDRHTAPRYERNSKQLDLRPLHNTYKCVIIALDHKM